MGYPRRLTLKQELKIAPIVEGLEALPPGSALHVHGKGRKETGALRYGVYVWLQVSGRKGEFLVEKAPGGRGFVVRKLSGEANEGNLKEECSCKKQG